MSGDARAPLLERRQSLPLPLPEPTISIFVRAFSDGALSSDLAPPLANAPPPSIRIRNREAVEASAQRHAFQRCFYVMLILFLGLLGTMFTGLLLLAKAVLEVWQGTRAPACSLLSRYMYALVAVLTCAQFMSRSRWARCQTVAKMAFFTSAYGVVTLFGFYALSASGDCGVADPPVFVAVRRYVHFSATLLCIRVVLCVGFSRATRFGDIEELIAGPGRGCEDHVRQRLERVTFDASAMMSEDDGDLEECPICLTAYSADKEIVRTACGHTFHLECLATWCRNRVACPLCREQLDKDAEMEAAQP